MAFGKMTLGGQNYYFFSVTQLLSYEINGRRIRKNVVSISWLLHTGHIC